MIVDVRTHPRSRVWLNGKEVTRWCSYADDGLGMVKLYKRDQEGRITEPLTEETKYGVVSIQRDDDALS